MVSFFFFCFLGFVLLLWLKLIASKLISSLRTMDWNTNLYVKNIKIKWLCPNLKDPRLLFSWLFPFSWLCSLVFAKNIFLLAEKYKLLQIRLPCCISCTLMIPIIYVNVFFSLSLHCFFFTDKRGRKRGKNGRIEVLGIRTHCWNQS